MEKRKSAEEKTSGPAKKGGFPYTDTQLRKFCKSKRWKAALKALAEEFNSWSASKNKSQQGSGMAGSGMDGLKRNLKIIDGQLEHLSKRYCEAGKNARVIRFSERELYRIYANAGNALVRIYKILDKA